MMWGWILMAPLIIAAVVFVVLAIRRSVSDWGWGVTLASIAAVLGTLAVIVMFVWGLTIVAGGA